MKGKAFKIIKIAVPAVLIFAVVVYCLMWYVHYKRFDKFDENYLLFSKQDNQSNYYNEENGFSYNVERPKFFGDKDELMGSLYVMNSPEKLGDIKTTEDSYSVSVIIKPQLFGGYEVQFEIIQAVNIRYLETVGYHTADFENVCNVTFDENLKIDKDATQEQKEQFEQFYDLITQYCQEIDKVWDIFELE